MIVTAMVLLGAALGVLFDLVERWLMKGALARRPGPLPPWRTIGAIALVYGGWALIRSLQTLDVAHSIASQAFIYASFAYAVAHLDVVMYVLRRTNSPATQHALFVWKLRDDPRARRVVALSLLVTAIGVFALSRDVRVASIGMLAGSLGVIAAGALFVIRPSPI